MLMDARTYWTTYVDRHGGPAGVARRTGIPYPTIAAVCNGSRGIGRALARRLKATDPLLDENVLVWVQAEKKRA